jgi:exodeoxyribonuclease-1
LYDWLFQLRSKHKVMEQIRLLQPLVHISGRFSAARNYLGVVCHWPGTRVIAMPDCLRPASGNLPLLRESAEVLRQRLYTRRDELAEGELPVPLKLVQINRCPVVAPLSVLRPADQQRLGWT